MSLKSMTAHSGLVVSAVDFSSSRSFAFDSSWRNAKPFRTWLVEPCGALPRDTRPFGFATGLMSLEWTAGPTFVGPCFGAPSTALRLLFLNFLPGALPAIQERRPH